MASRSLPGLEGLRGLAGPASLWENSSRIPAIYPISRARRVSNAALSYRVSQPNCCGLRWERASIMMLTTQGLPLAKASSSAGLISSGLSQK